MITTQQKIVKTALVHLSQKGYAGISLRDIAHDVGIKAASIYNHFKGKKELVKAVYDHIELILERDLLSREKVDNSSVQVPFGSLWNEWFREYKNQLHTDEYQNIIRLLSIEQYADNNAARLIIEYMIERPLQIAEKICGRYIEKKSSVNERTFAAEFFYPLFGMMHEFILRTSHNQNTASIEKRMKSHIDFFGRLVHEQK